MAGSVITKIDGSRIHIGNIATSKLRLKSGNKSEVIIVNYDGSERIVEGGIGIMAVDDDFMLNYVAAQYS